MSKGRFVAAQSLAENIYWHRTYDKAARQYSNYPERMTEAEAFTVRTIAWQRAQAIAKRYQRMKQRRSASISNPTCPDCGSSMRQTRRGATLAKRGPSYVCPVAEAEQQRDSDGRLYRTPGAKHTFVRAWSEDEVAR